MKKKTSVPSAEAESRAESKSPAPAEISCWQTVAPLIDVLAPVAVLRTSRAALVKNTLPSSSRARPLGASSAVPKTASVVSPGHVARGAVELTGAAAIAEDVAETVVEDTG